jgi:hypothetical protein
MFFRLLKFSGSLKVKIAPVLNYLSTIPWKDVEELRYSFAIPDLDTKWRRVVISTTPNQA